MKRSLKAWKLLCRIIWTHLKHQEGTWGFQWKKPDLSSSCSTTFTSKYLQLETRVCRPRCNAAGLELSFESRAQITICHHHFYSCAKPEQSGQLSAWVWTHLETHWGQRHAGCNHRDAFNMCNATGSTRSLLFTPSTSLHRHFSFSIYPTLSANNDNLSSLPPQAGDITNVFCSFPAAIENLPSVTSNHLYRLIPHRLERGCSAHTVWGPHSITGSQTLPTDKLNMRGNGKLQHKCWLEVHLKMNFKLDVPGYTGLGLKTKALQLLLH